VYVNGEFSISLGPWFKYYEIPSILKISQSPFVDIFTTGKTIKLQLSSIAPNSQNKNYKIQYVELGSDIHDCSTISSTEISCPIPKNTDIVGSDVSMKLSMDGENFELLDKKLYLFTTDTNSGKSITIFMQTLTPTVVSNSIRTNITIQIKIPNSISLPTSEILVRFKDQFIYELTSGIIQNGTVICEVPHFGSYNVEFPRNLEVGVSMNGVDFFGEFKTILMTGFSKVNVLPNLFIFGSSLRLFLSNFPMNLKPNEVMKMKLKSNNMMFDFNCNSNMTLCESSNNIPIDQYSIQFFINETRFYVPLSTEIISIEEKPSLTLTSNKILREMKNMMYLNGTGFYKLRNFITIRGVFNGKFSFAMAKVMPDKIGFLFPSIKRSIKRLESNTLEISYNGGFNYEMVSNNLQIIGNSFFNNFRIIFV
jgi:hypothetical protein